MRKPSDKVCSECGGKTLQFKGEGLDLQFRICPLVHKKPKEHVRLEDLCQVVHQAILDRAFRKRQG